MVFASAAATSRRVRSSRTPARTSNFRTKASPSGIKASIEHSASKVFYLFCDRPLARTARRRGCRKSQLESFRVTTAVCRKPVPHPISSGSAHVPPSVFRASTGKSRSSAGPTATLSAAISRRPRPKVKLDAGTPAFARWATRVAAEVSGRNVPGVPRRRHPACVDGDRGRARRGLLRTSKPFIDTTSCDASRSPSVRWRVTAQST
jgi:hypothetical protein